MGPAPPAPARPPTKAATVGPAPPATKPLLERDNLLLVGDSILHNANFKVIENATGTNVHTTKAYAADYDLKSRFPNKNFVYVARNAARKKAFKYVVLQSPSVHITNLNTEDNSEDNSKP